MNLTETVNLLKQMVSDCSNLNGHDFLIAPGKIPESKVDGYEIHMMGKFDDTTRKYLNDLALEKKLAITQHPDSIMIYNAKPNNA